MSTASVTINLHGAFYEAFRYPAGETQVRLKPECVYALKSADDVRIIARIHNAEDLIETLLLLDAVNEIHWSDENGLRVIKKRPPVALILPYLPYARADRRFTLGDCFGLRVFAEMLPATPIVTLDVHSDQSRFEVFNLINIDPMPIIQQAIQEFATVNKTDEICVLFPDAGARERYKVPLNINSNSHTLKIKTLIASKKRDPESGKFLGFEVPKAEEFTAPTLTVDDLCDAGGTFLGIGELIPASVKMGLYVTHGIFSKGVEILRQRYSWIGWTNSFQDIPATTTEFGSIFDAMPLLLSANKQTTTA